MISSNTELMLILNRWAVIKYLASNSTAKILPSVNSETKHSVQATTYKCIRKCIAIEIWSKIPPEIKNKTCLALFLAEYKKYVLLSY